MFLHKILALNKEKEIYLGLVPLCVIKFGVLKHLCGIYHVIYPDSVTNNSQRE